MRRVGSSCWAGSCGAGHVGATWAIGRAVMGRGDKARPMWEASEATQLQWGLPDVEDPWGLATIRGGEVKGLAQGAPARSVGWARVCRQTGRRAPRNGPGEPRYAVIWYSREDTLDVPGFEPSRPQPRPSNSRGPPRGCLSTPSPPMGLPPCPSGLPAAQQPRASPATRCPTPVAGRHCRPRGGGQILRLRTGLQLARLGADRPPARPPRDHDGHRAASHDRAWPGTQQQRSCGGRSEATGHMRRAVGSLCHGLALWHMLGRRPARWRQEGAQGQGQSSTPLRPIRLPGVPRNCNFRTAISPGRPSLLRLDPPRNCGP